MAVVNILAKGKNSINWDNLARQYSDLNLNNIEIFPIPKELGFDEDCLGISVQYRYPNKEVVISELQILIDFLISCDLKLVELYDGIEIFSDNIKIVAEKLLPQP